MPRPDPATEARIHQLTTCLDPAVTLLEELNDAFGPPCIQPIVKTVQALITGVQSETVGSLPPSVLDQTAEFTDTLHKIYAFLEIQQDGNKIKQFFQQNEINRLLKDCHTGLDQAVETFKVQTGFTRLNNVIQIQHEAETMHKDLLESSQHVLMLQYQIGPHRSNSFSLLPSKPKIFHGRDSELKHIMEVLSKDAPRIAILGGGGMGKTSLARAALHYTDTSTKFEHRFFVSAEAATTAVKLAALIGLHLGLEPGKDLTKPVIQYFARQTGLCLLILDNLETPWEPIQSHRGVENFLSLLADVEHLALMMKLLSMPLAVDLMAHLVDHEDGLSDAELTQSNLPIGNIQACKSVLIATSLAYKDTKSRLRSLVPIREHIQQFSPPCEPWYKPFESLSITFWPGIRRDIAYIWGLFFHR
ncbi:hypothetical protein B0H16DRAFT_1695756 [Mycena metata]|uniref:Novel STAND NTPase 1 domain-containing protein n=1 Tax=Mycena metata TaxID=1033252 RepID=A0AAD7MVP5_9AGAR|nr:hypothetical protein B0H16DRAFT_1695756 [Mycena metata]